MELINVANYKKKVQKFNYQFGKYREEGRGIHEWVDEQLYKNFTVPAAAKPPLFDGGPWEKEAYTYDAAPEADYMGAADLPAGTQDGTIQKRYRESTQWFNDTSPTWVAKKVLGQGSNGFAVHYNYLAPGPLVGPGVDIVVKLGIAGWEIDDLWREERITKRLRSSAHCVQMIHREYVGLPPRLKKIARVLRDDSSDDESTDDEAPARRTRNRTRARGQTIKRKDRDEAYRNAKDAAHQRRVRDADALLAGGILGRRDFVLLEYVENGSLASLIKKLTVDGSRDPVHFDIDPTNILINGFELGSAGLAQWKTALANDGAAAKTIVHTDRRPDREPDEHALVPRLKVQEHHFHVAYYLNKRNWGKQGFVAPEQFGGEWDMIDADPNGDEISEQETAGQYSCKTNIWQIAWTMWTLITQKYAPEPPQPQIPPHLRRGGLYFASDDTKRGFDETLLGAGYTGPISYCALLLDLDINDYDWVDLELRRVLFECMYHQPADRPTLESLLQTAKAKIAQDFHETDQQVRTWMAKWLYDAPTASGAPGSGSSSNDDDDSDGDAGGPTGSGAGSGGSGGGGGGGGGPDFRSVMSTRFPNGWDRIPNAAEDKLCGLYAIYDSLHAQLPAIATVITLPGVNTLQDVWRQVDREGQFDLIKENAAALGDVPQDGADGFPAAESNALVDQLAVVLMRWGADNGQILQLVCRKRGGQFVPVPATAGATIVWIYNDDAISDLGQAIRLFNHYEGIQAKEPSDEDVDDEDMDDEA
ncbi:putative Kinase-like protein [Seiridium unicorne]|uniref:Kinase-like protein n=1 Tax=Seiridium unicorne TaxID=138068 RepID=A0ABR2VD40_9PEZI